MPLETAFKSIAAISLCLPCRVTPCKSTVSVRAHRHAAWPCRNPFITLS